jgi:hypothetical protein
MLSSKKLYLIFKKAELHGSNCLQSKTQANQVSNNLKRKIFKKKII